MRIRTAFALVASLLVWAAPSALAGQASIAGTSPLVREDGSWRTVAAGSLVTCGVTTSGRVYCWGVNDVGQLGSHPYTNGARAPIAVTGLDDPVVAVSSGGGGQTCALTGDGTPWCWGPRPGTNGHSSANPVPVRDLSRRVGSVSAGFTQACAVTTAGGAFCWGDNTHGQLGTGSTTTSRRPVPVVGLPAGVSTVSAGGSPCALTADGTVSCWGRNGRGELGTGTSVPFVTVPTPVAGLSGPVAAISVGAGAACALGADGVASCWGRGYGNLPVPITSPEPFASISTGSTHACAVTPGGAAYCWGQNTYGQLGTGSTAPSESAVPVTGLPSPAATISAGEFHTCAVLVDRSAYCWGWGALGDGASATSATPVPVADPSRMRRYRIVIDALSLTRHRVVVHGHLAPRLGGATAWLQRQPEPPDKAMTHVATATTSASGRFTLSARRSDDDPFYRVVLLPGPLVAQAVSRVLSPYPPAAPKGARG